MSGSPSTAGVSTALLTDRYELTMVAAALADGTATRQCVFELFARRLPDGRRYGVVAGTGRLLESINRFRFGDQELAALDGVVDRGTLDWLADYRFSGDVDGYPEGELYFPGSPILTVRGTFADAVMLETLALSILNHDSAVAAAGGPHGLRGGRAAHHRDGVPAHPRGGGGRGGAGDVPRGVRGHVEPRVRTPPRHPDGGHGRARLGAPARRRAHRVREPGQGARRGDHAARRHLRHPQGHRAGRARGRAGARRQSASTRATSASSPARPANSSTRSARRAPGSCCPATSTSTRSPRCAPSPVDSYGVGTSVVTGSGAPTAGMVYKLVEVDGRPVAKRSAAKESRGGRKSAVRRFKPTGTAIEEVVHAAPRHPRSARTTASCRCR
jgi:nicotinate phosphoribosyltransferase